MQIPDSGSGALFSWFLVLLFLGSWFLCSWFLASWFLLSLGHGSLSGAPLPAKDRRAELEPGNQEPGNQERRNDTGDRPQTGKERETIGCANKRRRGATSGGRRGATTGTKIQGAHHNILTLEIREDPYRPSLFGEKSTKTLKSTSKHEAAV